MKPANKRALDKLLVDYKETREHYELERNLALQRAEDMKKKIDQIDHTIKRLPNQILRMEREQNALEQAGYAKLDGRFVKSVKKRRLDAVVGLKERPTYIIPRESYTIEGKDPYCYEWFAKVAANMNAEERTQMYDDLDRLRDKPEELKEYIGLWTMGHMI